jgi:hypothetical protein
MTPLPVHELIMACTVKGFRAIITGKKGQGVQATELFSLSVTDTNVSTKQFVLSPPLCLPRECKSTGVKSSSLGSERNTLGISDMVLVGIPDALFLYII